MKKSATRSLVQAACVLAVLAVIAIPLSNLMVAKTTAETTQAATTSEVVEAEAADASAVSALMSGSAVGPSRGAELNLRHPASAFVP